MRILKTIGLFLLIIIGIILISAIFIKKDMSSESEIIINKPVADVYNYIKYLKNQRNFSKWSSMDTAMKTEYKGTDATPGFVYSWESDKKDVGKGEQTITAITANRIDYDLHFIKPFESKATAYMITEPVSATQTKVRWGFKGRMNYPLNFIRLFMNVEESIGNDFSTGLSNLKSLLEKQ